MLGQACGRGGAGRHTGTGLPGGVNAQGTFEQAPWMCARQRTANLNCPGPIVFRERLGGLLRFYHREAT
jgi:hypothetical protein